MEYIKLNDISTIIMGQSPNSDTYNEIGEGVPFFQGKADFGRVNPKVRMYCSKPTKLAEVSDILMSVRAPVGDVNIANEQCCIGRGLCAIRGSIDINNKFLYYYLITMKEELNSKATGSTFKAINKSILEEVTIPNISIDKQNNIVKVLDKAQELIDKRKEQIEALDELVKSQFMEMFSDINEYVSISEYINSLTAGKSLAGELECKNKVLNTGSISYDYFDMNQVKNLPNDYIPKEEHLVNVGDVIISRMNTSELVGATAYVWNVNPNTYIPDRLWKANLKPNCDPIFVWQLLIQSSTKEKIRRISSGTSGSMKNISKAGLLGIEVIKVDIEKQNEFANFVKQVNKLKFEMEKSLKELEDNFNSLMQKAFNGELFN